MSDWHWHSSEQIEIAHTSSKGRCVFAVVDIGSGRQHFQIAFSYFVSMRIYIKREESKLEEMIQNLERIQKQFENNNL